jgi:hypothetical protein
MRPAVFPAIAAALVIGLAACASSGQAGVDDAAPDLTDPVVLKVTNQNFYDATVFVLTGSRRQRLGHVPSQGQRTFTFSWVDPQVRLELVLQSVGTYRTESITISSGESLEYAIPPDAHRRARRL